MKKGVWSLFLAAVALGLAIEATGVLAQQRGATAPPPPATRPPLLLKEDWKQPPYTGTLNDENRRATQDAITNPKLELKLYGADAKNVGVYNHEGRFDLWTGVVSSPAAIAVRDKSSYLDLTGLARVRAIVRTLGLHVIHPLVRLADGTYVAGSRSVDTEGEFVQTEVNYGGMRWHKLDPQKVVTGVEVKSPDLSKVDEIGFVDLAPGGGHGISGAFNLSSLEVYAKAAPR